MAVDRALRLSRLLGTRAPARRWEKAAAAIRGSVLTRGWSRRKGAFVQHYNTEALDSSNLLMPLFDFLPATDDRMRATLERTVQELSANGLLRRYRPEETDDGVHGPEGAFLLCSFWLVRNLIRLGRLDKAQALYERLLGYANHLGLFSEMADPASGELLGNFPQAFTHLWVIIAVLELTRALEPPGQP